MVPTFPWKEVQRIVHHYGAFIALLPSNPPLAMITGRRGNADVAESYTSHPCGDVNYSVVTPLMKGQKFARCYTDEMGPTLFIGRPKRTKGGGYSEQSNKERKEGRGAPRPSLLAPPRKREIIHPGG